jgi:transcriptional regulator with AAA-type ATPase domain
MIMQEHEDELEVRLAEIEYLIKDFRQTFKERTSTAENFITMTEIETMWGNLRQITNNIYAEMVQELLSEVDERDLIRKKKENTEKKEYNSEQIKLIIKPF